MKIAINLKRKTEYIILMEDVRNSTNAQDGQKMVIYQGMDNHVYVRETEEFYQKFRIKSPDEQTAIDLLKTILMKQGFDGLHYDEFCGCDMDHLNCCGESLGNCKPGYKHPPRNDNEDYFISPRKNNDNR